MSRKIGLLAITLLGLSALGGCQSMYGKSQRPGGCSGGSCSSCATGSTYAAPQASQGGYVPSSPAGGYGGGSGTK